MRLTENLATELGLYNGTIGTVTDIAFEEHVPPNKFKLLPKKNEDETLAKQAMAGRPLPIITLQMDNDKIDTNIFPNREVKIQIAKLKLLPGRKDSWERRDSDPDLLFIG